MKKKEKLYVLHHGGLYVYKNGWVTQKKYADVFEYKKAIEKQEKFLKKGIVLDIEEIPVEYD